MDPLYDPSVDEQFSTPNSEPAQVKMIPANIEAEQAVLGSLLIDPDAVVKVANFLRAEDFYRERHGWLYAAILSLNERREPIDLVTLTDELERREQLNEIGGPAYLNDLMGSTPTAIHVDHYARIVERTALLRRLISTAGKIAELAYDESQDPDQVVERAEQMIFGISESRIHRDLTPIHSIMQDVVNRLDFMARNQDALMGVPTGFHNLDQLLGGFQQSDLIILAARPGMGKSSFALSMALNAARNLRSRVGIFSLEMSNEQMVQRLLSMETRIDSHRLRLGQVYDDEWTIVLEVANSLANMSVFIDDTPGATVNDIRTKARRLYAEHGLDLVIIDYMQLMSAQQMASRSENRQQEISYISRSLKGLARELNVPVLALSQLSRAVESRADKRPMLSDLRESGCLSGDSQIYLPSLGKNVPIEALIGTQDVAVMSLNQESMMLEPSPVSHAFCTGEKKVFRLSTQTGRSIRATANHRFLTPVGWQRLDELDRESRVALASGERPLTHAPLTGSAVCWDSVASVDPAGVEKVYDLTVPINHNFVANDIIVHNSIEQDADVVMFIYREDYYIPDTDRQNIADVIVAKHRHGSTGTVSLYFRKELTQFSDMEIQRTELDY